MADADGENVAFQRQRPPPPISTPISSSASSSQPDTSANTTSESVAPSVEYTPYEGSMGDYCKQLENWLGRAYCQRECAVSAYYTALGMMYPPWNRGMQMQGNGLQNGGLAGGEPMPNAQIFPGLNNNNFAEPNLNIQNQMFRRYLVRGIRTNQNTVAFDFNIAPLWKRVFAECIDFFLLLVVKLFVTLTIIENFELINLDNLDLEALQQSGDLVELAVALSWELLILEVTHRIIVCFFEAYCLAKGGATPGKGFMRLRVLDCAQVIPISADMYQNNNLNIQLFPGGIPSSRVLVSPGSFLSFQRALIRSAIKNFSLAILFPFCFTLFQFEHSRTMYDLASRSIVVEIRQE